MGRWISPESLKPQACDPSLNITILATMLSGSLIPRWIARFVGSFTSRVDESEEKPELVVAAVLKAL